MSEASDCVEIKDQSEPFFTMDDLGRPLPRHESRKLRGMGVFLFAMTLALAGGGWWLYDQGYIASYEQNVFLELRALDELGRPLAGAIVWRNDQRVGRTDSFGEFRGYFTMQNGSRFQAQLTWDSLDRRLSATKNFVVPLRRQFGEQTELVASLKLSPEKKVTVFKSKRKEPAQADDSLSNESQSTSEVPAKPLAEANPPAQGPLGAHVELVSKSKDFTSASDRRRLAYLRESVIDTFQTKLRAELSNKWKGSTAIWHLSVAGKSGLMLVRYRDPQRRSFSYLRGYSFNPDRDVAGLLAIHKYHRQYDLMAKSPKRSWIRHQLIVSGLPKTGADVFVAGFTARRRPDTDIWDYWGPASGRVNVTVVDGDRIMHREKVMTGRPGQRIRIQAKSTPTARVARRTSNDALQVASRSRRRH